MAVSSSVEKDKEASSVGQLVGELFQAGLYKRNQGRITRQVTFGALVVGFAVGCWKFSMQLADYYWVASLAGRIHFDAELLANTMALVVLALGAWFSYRLVNLPRFADFLISVEAEMNKVSWPSRPELTRAALVVLFTIFFLAAVLFVFDYGWAWVFEQVGITGGPMGEG
jgi:preprotein translocase subunit SecE